jgi:hypothetical protein
MTNTEAIAAIIAANTPLKAEQYAAPTPSRARHQATRRSGRTDRSYRTPSSSRT